MKTIVLRNTHLKTFLLGLLIFLSVAAKAQTTWTGASSTDWSTATNWSTNAVPTATDDVKIPVEPANQPEISASVVAKSVELYQQASLTLTASGILTIDGSFSANGITTSIYNAGTITNDGRIQVGTSPETRGFGIWNYFGTSQVTNRGTISIDNIDNANVVALYTQAGTFTNSGTVAIGSAGNIGGWGIYNVAQFANEAGGIITVDRIVVRPSISAIRNQPGGTFTNAGNITTGSAVSSGQDGIINLHTFTNEASGEIHIDRSWGNGIWNTSNAQSFENSGLIAIGANAATGITGILNDKTFVNRPGGEIRIDRPSGDGINNRVGRTFTNEGLIKIGTEGSIGGNGITNDGTFENMACAALTVVDNIANSSSFTNAGFFTVNTTQPHTNSGLTNDGVIAYPQGNPIPDVTNNDLIALPRASLCATFKPALMLGGSNSFTAAAIWYKDEALTMPAGNYNPATNEFTATNLAPGSTTQVYLSVTDDANACARVVSIPLTTATVTPGPDQSVVFGFGSNCTDISATSNSSGPLSYSWDDGAGNGATVNVCPEETTTYTVTVTDGNGCQAQGQVTVNVQDVRCGNRQQNVTICYYGVTQCVSEKIARRYLRLGATLGGCGTGNARIGVPESDELPFKLSLKAFPNPVADAVTVEVLAPNAGRGTFEVLDVTGSVRQSRKQDLVEGLNEVEFRLGSLPTGIYMIKVVDALNQQGVVRVSKQ
ncbi:T9SS type A sorting domain-containing protein [Persicitalea jodogahamensis]|uniref:Secretion system C-terminal sorting domain-containing protein n=1 Tax=Persicitalea jodogahamensis TaxID=402147 RepID=A0A8J3DBH2_9BACT|nr:T9SS type A sorting domain-containing protein [Persicitalea jodogahamensis]GHB85707.1 hypothetical protein GCM10007390_46470 [Persicitalea jodogahamensis]